MGCGGKGRTDALYYTMLVGFYDDGSRASAAQWLMVMMLMGTKVVFQFPQRARAFSRKCKNCVRARRENEEH